MRMQMKSGQRPQTNEKAITTTITTSNDLVVVSSQKSDSNTEPDSSKSILDAKIEKYNNVAVSELPAIKGSKRHMAWHNMKK